MTDEELQNKWAWWQEGDERFHMCNSESEAHGEAQEYCEMVKLWKATKGQAGWPAYNGEGVCK